MGSGRLDKAGDRVGGLVGKGSDADNGDAAQGVLPKAVIRVVDKIGTLERDFDLALLAPAAHNLHRQGYRLRLGEGAQAVDRLPVGIERGVQVRLGVLAVNLLQRVADAVDRDTVAAIARHHL